MKKKKSQRRVNRPSKKAVCYYCGENKSKKIILNRDSWTSRQTGVLIKAWTDHFSQIDLFYQPIGWLKVKVCVKNVALKNLQNKPKRS